MFSAPRDRFSTNLDASLRYLPDDQRTTRNGRRDATLQQVCWLRASRSCRSRIPIVVGLFLQRLVASRTEVVNVDLASSSTAIARLLACSKLCETTKISRGSPSSHQVTLLLSLLTMLTFARCFSNVVPSTLPRVRTLPEQDPRPIQTGAKLGGQSLGVRYLELWAEDRMLSSR